MPTPRTDFYSVLGVDPGANAVTIRKAVIGEQRRCGARQNAPDLATRQDAERHAQLLIDIRDVLLDPGQRALYDVQRVEALPDRPPPTSERAERPGWGRRIAGLAAAWSPRVATLGVALVLLLFLATRSSTSSLPVSTPTPPGVRATHLSFQPPVPAMPELATLVTSDPTLAAAVPTHVVVPATPSPTRAAVVPRSLLDEVPVTLSGLPLSPSSLPVLTQAFSLAGGHYGIAWSVAGRQPCDFIITIADAVSPGLVRTTLSNHVLNRSDGLPAQGQTSINLNGGKYRMEAASDTCEWSLTLRAN